MSRAFLVAAALALAASGPAIGQRVDINGRCHNAAGKLIPKTACKTAKTANGVHHMYLRDAQGACHDEKGRVVIRSLCKR